MNNNVYPPCDNDSSEKYHKKDSIGSNYTSYKNQDGLEGLDSGPQEKRFKGGVKTETATKASSTSTSTSTSSASTIQVLVPKETSDFINNKNEIFSSGSSLLSNSGFNDLRNNDNRILSLLNQESGSNYSFKGLMRKLNLHQQSLSRALRRLEYLEYIAKSPEGYSLTQKAKSILTNLGSTASFEEKTAGDKSRFTQIIQTYIPMNIKLQEIVDQLANRWFSNLRWAGLIVGETEYILQWTNEKNTFQVRLRISSGYLIVDTNAVSDKAIVQAMIGISKIFQYVTEIFHTNIFENCTCNFNINGNLLDQNN